jgi:glycosyltransferase involved in cell wall biosynthesis
MKVLQVIASLSPARGGTTTAVNYLASALHLRGIKVDIAATDDDGPDQHLHLERNSFIHLPDRRVIYFRRQTGFYSTSLPMLAWLFRNAHRYDVIHAHGLFNFAPVAAALSAANAKRPYILTVHGTLDSWALKNRRPAMKRLSIRLLESRILRGAAVVHFTSEIERLHAERLKYVYNSMVIPLGVDLSLLTKPAPLVRPKELPDGLESRPTVLFLSRIDLKKGLDVLLNAFCKVHEKVPSALLAIAGDGDPQFVEPLRQLAQRLRIADNVHWLGFVSGQRKSWLLQNCALFALPSQSENFGLAVVEAMASGLPVIVSPGVALAQLVNRYAAGAVCNPNADELSSTLINWLSDPAKRKRAGDAGRRLAFDEMSLEAFGRRFEELYKAVVAERDSGSAA